MRRAAELFGPASILFAPMLQGAQGIGSIALVRHPPRPFTDAEIDAAFADRIETVERIAWDARTASVVARRERRLGRLLLDDGPLPNPDPAAIMLAMIAGIRSLGLAALPWSREAEQLRARIATREHRETAQCPRCGTRRESRRHFAPASHEYDHSECRR